MMQLTKPDADEVETFDQYIGAEFMINDNGDSVPAKVTKRARGNDGNPFGKRHANPLLETREYECELKDGTEHLLAM
jgi:hypothetical protein